MKRWFLAAALLFLSASLASADYVIIVANLAPTRELQTPPGGQLGVPGGIGGVPGGVNGVPGGIGGVPGGVRGVPGGIGGVPGGVRGVPGGFGGGQVGLPPGMGNRGGRPGLGQFGNAGIGGAAGMRGFPGNFQGGGPGLGAFGNVGFGGMTRGGGLGMMGGLPFPGMGGGATDVDDVPYFVIAVVEVKSISKDLAKTLQTKQVAKVSLPPRFGETCQLLAKTPFCETIVLTQDSNRKPLATVADRFQVKFDDTFKNKEPTAELVLELADWTLTHGLVGKDYFPKIMDKLVEIDKSHPAAVAYSKLQEALKKTPAKDDAAASRLNQLLKDYKVEQSDHYLLAHNSGAAEVKRHLEQLENSFRGFYYWFALKGVVMPLPEHRQVAVMTNQVKDFQHFHDILSSGPVVVDGFFARHENVSVMASERQDESYDMLRKAWKFYSDRGFVRGDLLSKKPHAGHPRGADQLSVATAQMMDLMLKALENEAELATISHDASRQLLFASGMMPRNVAAPEWLLFGMGSFFETPLQSPWAGIGAPNAYYLPRWNELKGKGFEKERSATLRKVVADAYFRGLPPMGAADSPARHAHDAALRKARTAAWSLGYFLAKNKLDGLQRYFKELSKMPRDIELDDEVLVGCFVRAFGAVDGSNKEDKAKLSSLANQWYSYMDNVKFESESTMKQIREHYRKMLAQMQTNSNPAPGQVDPITGKPIQPGGNPPGVVPPGGPGGGIRPPPVRPGGNGQPPGRGN